jgi:hypothetical protein
MLQIQRFDIKTGKPIQENLEGSQQPTTKQVDHTYLEHWLEIHEIKAEFSIARFYESVNNFDRLRLESEGKVLVFTSGSDGYFTDPATARLMVQGSQTVRPIYASNGNSPHNSVAYGSLVASEGVASTTISFARILVIDDEGRTHGDQPLINKDGRLVPARQLQALYDRMGDGTMLVSEDTMQDLQTNEERDKIALKAAERAGISGDISALAQEVLQADTAVTTAEHQEFALARRSVVQFRAASPDLPGIIKGTMASSDWCDRLGVDAIISSNDIKGDDGRLSAPGIKAVSNFWVNRKASAQYGQQSVGPQVKYTIPEATRLEINPKVQVQAKALAPIAGDFAALSQHYLEQKERERSRPYQGIEDEWLQTTRPDWLYDTLSADKYGQLANQAKVVDGLSRYVRGEWLRLAMNGTSVPSAMAQHHSQLKPWEVCNKDLPHGAIVAYYRSPFPNVGAAAIAINNIEIIQASDREAFSKQGVAYLPPWTAKNIAISDFDGDMNGFFVGYQATVSDLPQQVRAELESVLSLPPDQQYEEGRALFARMVQQLEQGQETRIAPGESPLAVKEFAERNAPEVRPPEIIKQTKEKHSWQEGESHAAATWRAWEITAENPTGKVANAGMSLQALALEMRYAPAENKEALLRQVSKHFSKLLVKVDAGKVSIPDDDWLSSQNFSPFYRERIEDIATASVELSAYQDPLERREFTEVFFEKTSELLSEVASGPNAVNLQTAVDMAKSAKGIDEDLHKFVMALQYKPDVLRKSKNDPSVYVNGRAMPTNTEEPIAWNVQLVNEHYRDARLEERLHQEFQAIFPKTKNVQLQMWAQDITRKYNALIRQAVTGKSRQRERRPEDQKPTLQVTSANGRMIVLQNIQDEQGNLPIWRAEGPQPNWVIRVKHEPQANLKEQFPAQLIFTDSQGVTQAEPLGYVSVESAQEHNLAQALQQPGQLLTIPAPSVTTQVSWLQQNDTDFLYEEARRHLEIAFAPPEGKDPEIHRQELAIALWQRYEKQAADGRHIVMKQFPDILRDHLSQLPQITVGRLQISGNAIQRLIDKSPHTIQFGKDTFASKSGDVVVPSVSVLKPDGDGFLIGAVAARNVALPEGATYMAAFSKNPGSALVVEMQVMDLPTIEQTSDEIAAFQSGRSHLTFYYEPHTAYGVREGQVVIAQAPDGGEQIALRVGGHHPIDATLVATAGAAQRWAAVEQSSPERLNEHLSVAHREGKELWGLNVQPLGIYRRGQITPFEVSAMAEPSKGIAQQTATSPIVSEARAKPSVAEQPVPEKSESEQLWEKYSAQPGGSLAIVAAKSPGTQAYLDLRMAQRAIKDGCLIEAVIEAITQHSPLAREMPQPETYASGIVLRSARRPANTASPVGPAVAGHTQPQSKVPTPARRAASRDSGMEL